jgi:hypothetical protein
MKRKFLNPPKKMLLTLLCGCLFLFMIASCEEESSGKSQVPHDPNKPIELEKIMPTSGKLREKVIIKGTNFGTDASIVKVSFVDSVNERKAVVIGLDNNTIYCMAPRQNPGVNRIKIVVGDQEIISTQNFTYTQDENVTTIAGTSSDRSVKDGSLTDARFSYCWGIGAIGNESMLVFQRDNPCVRLVSVPDNKVTTIHPGFKGGKPAVSKDKTKVYDVAFEKPHAVYAYLKETGWSPNRIGQLGDSFDKVLAVALDETEEWLYFVSKDKKFARFSLKNKTVELIKTLEIGSLGANGPYLVYNPVLDCFFMSSQDTYSVYRLEKDGTWDVYAGSSTSARVADGYGTEACFRQPNGMTVDEDGNIYIVEGFYAYVLRKITISDGYVSTIAGKVNVCSQIDGTPINATFNYPYDISYDGEGGYWICEGWGGAIRKYAVE